MRKRLFHFILLLIGFSRVAFGQQAADPVPHTLMGHRFLTFNTVIRVNQIEVSRTENKGVAIAP